MTRPDPVVPSCHCATCADEGVPMRVVAIEDGAGLARCAAADGVAATVETTLVEPVAPGDMVLVHAGVALIRLQADSGSRATAGVS